MELWGNMEELLETEKKRAFCYKSICMDSKNNEHGSEIKLKES